MRRIINEGNLTLEELLLFTGMDKYHMKWLQKQAFFTPGKDGLYDSRWGAVNSEARQYIRAGFDRLDAYCEACKDLFGRCPEWCEE